MSAGLSNYWNWWDQFRSRMSETEREEELRKHRTKRPITSKNSTVIGFISEFDSEWNRKACEEARKRREKWA